MRLSVNPRLLWTVLSASAILIGSVVAIRYAQGYRLSFTRKGFVQGTGLLVANSFPSGAEVYINNNLTSATDNTIYLEPGEYDVKIIKDSYLPWEKKLQVERELVTQTNAQLFRRVPSLTPLTSAGAKNISASPDGQKLLFYSASASAQTRNGLYVLELGSGFLPNQREPRQIVEENSAFDLQKAQYVWSPDGSEVLAMFPTKDVLLDIGKKNNLQTLPDQSLKKKQLLSEWESILYTRERQFFDKFPDEVLYLATTSAKNLYLSPDKKKLLYTATASATIPENITPPPPARNSQPEDRVLRSGTTYVYDREEDRNFALTQLTTAQASKIPSPTLSPKTPAATASANTTMNRVYLASDLFNKEALRLDASPAAFTRLQASSSAETAWRFASVYSSLYSTGVQWFPDSKHLIFADNERIYIIEYDNTNKTSVYAGPFLENFIYPWPDGNRLLINTTFSANTPPNLYAIELK